MDLFRAVLELMGSMAMLFVAGSLCFWGPMLLKAIHRVEKSNSKQWERHYEFEVKKANDIIERIGLQIAPPEPKDIN